jgi:hypothetical protein
MRILTAPFVLCLAAVPARAGEISFAYNLAEPNLGANQIITQLNLGVTVQSSALGMNIKLANPAVATNLIPNPFIMPPPDCKKMPQSCTAIPKTIDGVDPKTMANPQFDYVPNSFAVTPGAAMNMNLKAPGIPAGTTVRTDTAALSWTAPVNPDFFGKPPQLRFGATLNVQTATNLLTSKPVYPSKASFSSATWLLNDNTKVNTAVLAAHTIQMGQDVFDLNNNFQPGLIASYTNDAMNDVTLTDLVFFTTSDDNALAEPDPQATFLTNPLVSLNGMPLPTQSSYDVPSGETLQFMFPDTSDPFFVTEADVSADGIFQLGYGYEAQVQVPEPPSWAVFALAYAALVFGATRRRWPFTPTPASCGRSCRSVTGSATTCPPII